MSTISVAQINSTAVPWICTCYITTSTTMYSVALRATVYPCWRSDVPPTSCHLGGQWNMTASGSMSVLMTARGTLVFFSWGSLFHHATAHTRHSTPVEVYVLLECMRSTASLPLCTHALTPRTSSESRPRIASIARDSASSELQAFS